MPLKKSSISDIGKGVRYGRITIDDSFSVKLDRFVHVISPLPVFEDGMILYDELLKRGIDLCDDKTFDK